MGRGGSSGEREGGTERWRGGGAGGRAAAAAAGVSGAPGCGADAAPSDPPRSRARPPEPEPEPEPQPRAPSPERAPPPPLASRSPDAPPPPPPGRQPVPSKLRARFSARGKFPPRPPTGVGAGSGHCRWKVGVPHLSALRAPAATPRGPWGPKRASRLPPGDCWARWGWGWNGGIPGCSSSTSARLGKGRGETYSPPSLPRVRRVPEASPGTGAALLGALGG